MIEEWFAPADINFSRENMMWLIRHKDELLEGDWPANPWGSSYTDIPSIKGGSNEARFVRPCQFAAEVEVRLKQTGLEGRLLRAELNGGWHDVPYEQLSKESRDALNYISGWRRRKQSYREFKKQRRYRR